MRLTMTGRGETVSGVRLWLVLGLVLAGSAAQIISMARQARSAGPASSPGRAATTAPRPRPRVETAAPASSDPGRPQRPEPSRGRTPVVHAALATGRSVGGSSATVPAMGRRQAPAPAEEAPRTLTFPSPGQGAERTAGPVPGAQARPTWQAALLPAPQAPTAPAPPAGGHGGDSGPGRAPVPAEESGSPGQESTADPESGGTQLLALAPTSVSEGEVFTIWLNLENGSGVAHAPVTLTFDPEVLSFVEASEGPLLASDGAATAFLSKEIQGEGIVQIGLSRIPPAGGLAGSGILCGVTFQARQAGDSPIGISSSRLLNTSGRTISFRRNDSHVLVN